jgi:hypothetical protein
MQQLPPAVELHFAVLAPLPLPPQEQGTVGTHAVSCCAGGLHCCEGAVNFTDMKHYEADLQHPKVCSKQAGANKSILVVVVVVVELA